MYGCGLFGFDAFARLQAGVAGAGGNALPLEPFGGTRHILHGEGVDDAAARQLRQEMGQPREPAGLVVQLEVAEPERAADLRSTARGVRCIVSGSVPPGPGRGFARNNLSFMKEMAGVAPKQYFGQNMNRRQIEAAVERNLPFTLRMADGKEYRVPHRDYIFFPPRGAFVVVFDDREHVYVLPLLTMTGLAYQSDAPKAKR